MLSDPVVEVTCDQCSDTELLGLTVLAGGCYDERGILGQLRRMGWIATESGSHFCSPECHAFATGGDDPIQGADHD